MATNPVECPERVESETLSALRDDLLSGDEAARLREHLPSCAACQARLSDYDAVARALLRQRELEPGERIIRGVRRSVADGRALRGLARRRLWGGLGGLASVAAVLLLFLYIFGQQPGRGAGPHPGTPTASRSPNATATTSGGPFQVSDAQVAPQLNIAYVQNNEVWIGLRGGQPIQVTHLDLSTPDTLTWRLAWSADGSKLLAVANDDIHATTVAPRAWIIATATGAVTALPQATAGNLGGGCEMACSWLGDRYIAHANPTVAATHYLEYQIYDTQSQSDLTTALDQIPITELETRGAEIYFSPYTVSPGSTPGTISRFDLASDAITTPIFTAPGPLVSQGIPAANWDISANGSSVVYEFGFGLSTGCATPPCYTYYQDRSGKVMALFPGYQSQAASGAGFISNLVISPDGATAAMITGGSSAADGTPLSAAPTTLTQQRTPNGQEYENALPPAAGSLAGSQHIAGWTAQTPGIVVAQPRLDANGNTLSTSLYFAPLGGSGNVRLVESLALPVDVAVSVAPSA